MTLHTLTGKVDDVTGGHWMSLKKQAFDLVTLLYEKLKALPPTSKSDWIKTDVVTAATGVAESDIKGMLRRPAIRKLLDKAGIRATWRKEYMYAYRTSTFGTQITLDDVGIDDSEEIISAPEETAVADDWSLDSNYFWYPPCHEDIQTAADANMNIFMVGPAGSGKSTLLRRVFANRGAHPTVVSFTGETNVDDLVGSKELVPHPDGKGIITEFVEGVLPRCMRQGHPLIIDEADATPPDVQFVLHPVLMGEPLLLTKKAAEYIYPEVGFLIAATGNTLGRGDDTGLYVGTNVLNEAYLDRYGIVIEHWYMPEQEEMRVLVKRTGIHRKMAEKMVEVGKLARDAMIADKLSSTFSTRKMLDWSKLVVRGMDLGHAYVLACINKVSRDDKKAVAEFAQRVFGQAIKVDPNNYT